MRPRRLIHGATAAIITCGAILALVALVPAGTANGATALTATAVRIGDHPAYVRAVIDFAGVTPRANGELSAVDAQPADGSARLELVLAGVHTRAAPRAAYGLSARVRQDAHGLRIDLGAARLRFKWLSYAWVTGRHLAIELWKSSPPSAGAQILRAPGGCLTLDRGKVNGDGVVRVAGRERGVFEHQFRVIVRGADGRPLYAGTVHARNGRWSATMFVSSTRRQAGTLEAAALSPADGALICLVQRRIVLPFTGPGPLRLVYRTHADLDGDGRADVVSAHKTNGQHGSITATLATGRAVSIQTATFSVALPAIVAVGNVDGRAGDELFVDVEHISTNEFIGIYTYWHGQFRLAKTLAGYSAHPGLWAGMTCSARGSKHLITVHQFVEQARGWTRQDTVYAWSGPTLVVSATEPARAITGTPPPILVGLHCGHAPR
jgi:hypothetical protein